MTVPPTSFPEPGQPGNWATQLTNAITDRDAIIKDLAEGRVTPAQLAAALAPYPLGVGVRRVVASENPNVALQHGDLLLVLPGVAPFQWYTDFTEYTVGQAPLGWSVRWEGSNFLEVVEDGDGTGGVLLREDYQSTSGQNRAITWDAVGQLTDVEVVFKWRASSIAAGARGVVRASSEVPRYGYHGGVQNATTDSLQKLTGGTASDTLASATRSFASNTWYVTRLRAVGSTIACKTWAADATEPATWDFEEEDTSIADAGWVGARVFSTAGVRDFDWFGVAAGGASAPTEPVGV